MKSRKGKKASRRLAVENMKKLIDEKFSKCKFDDREKLFDNLQKWAYESLSKEACEIFIEALYNADSTQDIQMTRTLTKALERIGFGGKK